MNEDQGISIPIKPMLEEAVANGGCKFPEDEFNMLRKYFIACLNLGYLEPKDLKEMCHKFCDKIKFIVTTYSSVNMLDYYMIRDNILYINDNLKNTSSEFYEISFYKAVSTVLFGTIDKNVGFENALCEITAEKVFNMDVNDSRVILPKTVVETINGKVHHLRSGYNNYNLVITLLKELFMSKDINETLIIRNLFFKNFDGVLNEILTESNEKLALMILDKICLMEVKRKVNGINTEDENDLIYKYQVLVEKLFVKKGQNYYAFCALITIDELRDKYLSSLPEV